tara:strand:- start:513 stop:662 length:150 start_codon:yes stop_codon:yes gene_type:complete
MKKYNNFGHARIYNKLNKKEDKYNDLNIIRHEQEYNKNIIKIEWNRLII